MPSVVRLPLRLESVQMMRAVAALMVCVWHCAGQADRLYPTPFMHMVHNTHLGTGGVFLFFIISGFIMMHATLAQFGQPGSAKGFAIRRLVRIVPSYWFFTSLVVLMTLAVPGQMHSARFTPWHALLSYLFVPHLAPGRVNSTEPIYVLGWTLNYEMFFYAVLAVGVMWKVRSGLMFVAAIFGFVFVAAQFGIWDRALNLFWGDSILFLFLLGIAAYFVHNRYQPSIVGRGLFIAAAILWLVFLPVDGTTRSLQRGMPALFLFFALLGLPMTSLVARALVVLGDASYALYLSHSFVSAAFVGVAGRWGPKSGAPGIPSAVLFGTALLASIAVSVIYYRYCERPVTDWLSMKFVGRRPTVEIGSTAQ